jgi:hypothetical protein
MALITISPASMQDLKQVLKDHNLTSTSLRINVNIG